MISNNHKTQEIKISSEFNTRLNRLKPQEKVHAIIMLHTQGIGKAPRQRNRRDARQATIENIRKSSVQALIEINTILEHFNGKLLADKVDALGCVPIETTNDGIHALATSKHIKAILEDQPISALSVSKHR